MALESGSRIGPYAVLDRLGVGGMGEVWRAGDERLGREVALKVLPDSVAHDSERLARFEREARTLATLSHPNIAILYGLEEAEGTAYLVMELAEGEELGQLIERGPVPFEEVAAIARQIAEALEAAHEQGVVHRDLKPANIKIAANGQIKVLDFGLAKTWEVAEGEGALSLSPTLTAHATAAGVILGTAAYMSPEQARGRPVDKRADIWSFGVVLWEMLTGRRLFEGETVTDILASVLKEAPDLGALPADTPETLRTLLGRCLVHDPNQRLRDMGEARIALSAPLAERAATAPPAKATSKRRSAILGAMAGSVLGAVVTMAILAGGGGGRADPRLDPARVSLPLTPAAQLDLGVTLSQEAIAISPDGLQMAFTALDGEGVEAVRRLFVRDLGESLARSVPGTEEARAPFFSPDGRWLAFLQKGRLARTAAAGGAIQPLPLPANTRVWTASWAPEGQILAFGTDRDQPEAVFLWGLDPDDGAVETLHRIAKTELKGSEVRWIQALPGHRGILFTRLETENLDNSTLDVLDLSSGEIKTLLSKAFRPRLLGDDRILYSDGGRLYLVPFDAEQLAVTGPSRVVLEDLAVSPIEGNSWYEASATGSLISIPESEIQGDGNSMLRVDAAGSSQIVEGRARYFVDPRLSPDGNRLAFSLPTDGNDIWVHDFARGTQTRLSSEAGEDETPVWSPDGQWIVWGASRTGQDRRLLRRRPDGSGAVEAIWSSEHHFHPSDWSSSGDLLVIDLAGPETGFDIWVLPMEDPEAAHPILAERHGELHSRLSPDGRWLAYTSDETGRAEVYLQSFPALDRKVQVSASGGYQAIWSAAGDSLFFRSSDGMWVVSLEGGSDLSLSSPKLLFPPKYAYGKGFGHFGYDVAPDGTFLMSASDASSFPRRIDLYLGWLGTVDATDDG